jgi:hypothetical protein
VAERDLIITVADADGVVVDTGYVTIDNARGDARDAVEAIVVAAESAEIVGMPDDWSPGVPR